jgi:hypothetical protein
VVFGHVSPASLRHLNYAGKPAIVSDLLSDQLCGRCHFQPIWKFHIMVSTTIGIKQCLILVSTLICFSICFSQYADCCAALNHGGTSMIKCRWIHEIGSATCSWTPLMAGPTCSNHFLTTKNGNYKNWIKNLMRNQFKNKVGSCGRVYSDFLNCIIVNIRPF